MAVGQDQLFLGQKLGELEANCNNALEQCEDLQERIAALESGEGNPLNSIAESSDPAASAAALVETYYPIFLKVMDKLSSRIPKGKTVEAPPAPQVPPVAPPPGDNGVVQV